jgi:hypothetical protein
MGEKIEMETVKKAKGERMQQRENVKKHSLFFSLFLFVANKSFSLLGFCVPAVQTDSFKSPPFFVGI